MKHLLSFTQILTFTLLFVSQAGAQNIGLQIDTSQNVLFGDSLRGEGTKLMWIPSKGAFRAGSLTNTPGSGVNEKTLWDTLGLYSTAFGYNTAAKGASSMAWGDNTTANRENSTTWGRNGTADAPNATAWGDGCLASSFNATAWGNTNQATGSSSTAWGFFNIASGEQSTVWGQGNIAQSHLETVIGRYADTVTVMPDTRFWDRKDYLFVIGNGLSNNERNNAITVYKSGITNIDAATKIGDIGRLTRAKLMVDDRDVLDRTPDGSTVRIQSSYFDAETDTTRLSSLTFGISSVPDKPGANNTNGWNINQSAIWNTYSKNWWSTMRFGVRTPSSGQDLNSDFSNLHEFMNADGKDKRVTISQVLNVSHDTDPATSISKEGDMYYNTTTHRIRVFSQGSWRSLAFE